MTVYSPKTMKNTASKYFICAEKNDNVEKEVVPLKKNISF